MKSLRNLTAIALTAVLAFVISGCSSDGGDDPVLPLPPAHVHAYSDSWTSNETHHWHAATCGHDVKKDLDVHGAAAELGKDATGHWKVCGVCNASFETTSHTWDHEDFQLDAASEKEIKTCTVCGFVADKNHVHTEDSGTVTKAATCTEKGLRTYKCTLCDKVLRTEEIAVTDHTEDGGTVTKAATCTEKGMRTYKCTVCDKLLRTEEIPASNHTEDSGTVTPPTCVTKGVKTYKCSVCKVVLRTEELPELPELYSSPVDAETGMAATKSSKYIYFGVFPKTVLPVGSTVIVDDTIFVNMGADTYYKGSDGEYYAKVMENAYDNGSASKYSDGTQAKEIISNSYRYFKVEPIKWKVITKSYKGKCLLLAEDILTANVPYNVREKNNYKYSTIRAYLNGKYESDDTQSKTAYENKGFLQTAFTAEAQNLIAVTTVDNSAESTTDSGWNLNMAIDYDCADTEDKIFLLSMKEATSYDFPAYNKSGAGNARIRKPTDYAMANHAARHYTADYGGYWWLRSPDYLDSYGARYVSFDGAANLSSKDRVTNSYGGVVPALSISLQ